MSDGAMFEVALSGQRVGRATHEQRGAGRRGCLAVTPAELSVERFQRFQSGLASLGNRRSYRFRV